MYWLRFLCSGRWRSNNLFYIQIIHITYCNVTHTQYLRFLQKRTSGENPISMHFKYLGSLHCDLGEKSKVLYKISKDMRLKKLLDVVRFRDFFKAIF